MPLNSAVWFDTMTIKAFQNLIIIVQSLWHTLVEEKGFTFEIKEQWLKKKTNSAIDLSSRKRSIPFHRPYQHFAISKRGRCFPLWVVALPLSIHHTFDNLLTFKNQHLDCFRDLGLWMSTLFRVCRVGQRGFGHFKCVYVKSNILYLGKYFSFFVKNIF